MKKVKQTKNAVIAVDSKGVYHVFSHSEWGYASIYFNTQYQTEAIYKISKDA